MNDWNKQVIEEFRANGGKVAQFGDAPMIILNTIGAKSHELRETPLVALVRDDEMVVFGSKAGATSNPDWVYNLRAHPEIEVEFGVEKFNAIVTELPEADGQARLAEQAELMPQFGEYAESAKPRVIPAFSIVHAPAQE